MTATSRARAPGGDAVVPEPLPPVPSAGVLRAAAQSDSDPAAARRSQRAVRVVATLGLAAAAGLTSVALLTAQSPGEPPGTSRGSVPVTTGGIGVGVGVGTAGLTPAIEPPATANGASGSSAGTAVTSAP